MDRKKKNILPRRKWPFVALVLIFLFATLLSFSAVAKWVVGIFSGDKDNPIETKVDKIARTAGAVAVAVLSVIVAVVGFALSPWIPIIGPILIIVGAVWFVSSLVEIQYIWKPQSKADTNVGQGG